MTSRHRKKTQILPGKTQSQVCIDVSAPVVSPHGYGELLLPVEPRIAKASLNCAVAEIYRRKTAELSDLLSRYMAGLGEVRRYPSTLAVERDGQSIELSMDSILAIEAERKSVWIYTLHGTFLLRKPIHQLEAELDPAVFARIHRSIIVNLHHLTAVPHADKSLHVVLSDGSRYPVGLNYRESIAQLLNSRRAS